MGWYKSYWPCPVNDILEVVTSCDCSVVSRDGEDNSSLVSGVTTFLHVRNAG